jgi:O-acetyl-ADP-ribose deacetylase (regulator of RNase III)
MKLILVDRDPTVCAALAAVLPFAEVRNCLLSEIPPDDFDVICTPGNSQGFMDGGFDLAVREYFPWVEQEIQNQIKQFYYGKLAVGQAISVMACCGPQLYKVLAYAPSMRVPESIVGTDNVYWSFRAALLSIRAGVETRILPPVEQLRILSPAFGTSAGMMTATNAAHQMRLAFEHATRSPEQVEYAHSWHQAWNDHNQIRSFR